MADPERSGPIMQCRMISHAAAADARHRQGVPRRPRARRGRPRRRRGRGALPARPERRRQVDPDQGPRRRAPPGRGRDPLGRRARSPSARRTTPTPPGIATIHQELDLVAGLSVAENIVLGHEPGRFGFSRPRAAEDAARALLRRLGHPEIPPRRELGRLSAAGQQIVSMARALSRDARLIVMDEPSAVLDADEVDNLFRVVRELTADGRRGGLHLAPAGGDPPHRRPGDGAQGRPHRRPQPPRAATPRPPR